jgi:methylene-fatty-acyl-phospholipid synthase
MLSTDFGIASAAIVLHVLNYNLTAQVEHKTRVFTKGFGKNAVYIYAVYLVLSALVRDHFINLALVKDSNSMHIGFVPFSYILFFGGVALNLWTLSALGMLELFHLFKSTF